MGVCGLGKWLFALRQVQDKRLLVVPFVVSLSNHERNNPPVRFFNLIRMAGNRIGLRLRGHPPSVLSLSTDEP